MVTAKFLGEGTPIDSSLFTVKDSLVCYSFVILLHSILMSCGNFYDVRSKADK